MRANDCSSEAAVDGKLTDAEVGEIGEAIAQAAACLDAATHRLLTQLRRFDACDGWFRQGALSCAHWLSWRTGISSGAAREQVRVARKLGELPLVDAALSRGELSYSKVRAMTRVAGLTDEATLLDLARRMTASELEKTCRIVRQQLAPASPRERDDRRQVRVRETDDGLVVIEAHLRTEEAATVLAGIDASAETRADGLVALAEAALRSQAPSGGPAVEVTVTIDASTFEGHTGSGFGIGAETARRLCCDAGIIPAVLDGEGKLLGVGRKTRTIPATLRRALRLRDQQCRFPGCDNHRFVDAHHLVHWADGGETSLENTCLLCPRHHTLVHEHGFSIECGPAGDLRFQDPQGHPVPATPTPSCPVYDWPQIPTAAANLPRADWDPVDYDACLDVLVATHCPAL
jgi:hypothetical protein